MEFAFEAGKMKGGRLRESPPLVKARGPAVLAE
jgi:hypothetical protein